MEIKIDTERDSKQDIKKVIVFLQDLIGEAGFVDRFDNSSSRVVNELPVVNESSPSSNQSSGFNRDLSMGSSHSYSNLSDSDNFKSQSSESLRHESRSNYDVPSDGLFNIFSESSKNVAEKKNVSMNDLMSDNSFDEDDDEDNTPMMRDRVDIIPY
jgi:hypothetical protein